MLNRLPLTRIKIAIAKIIYFFIRFFIRKNPIMVTRQGIQYELDLTEGIDLSIFLFGGFQKHVYDNLKITNQSSITIIDIGANMGCMSLTFAKMFPNSFVKSFEPTHYACERFKKNMQLNLELSQRIELIQSFISDSNDDKPAITAYASWKVGGDNQGSAKHAVHQGTAMDTTGIGAKTLDWFCENNQYENIKLIKIDTDGHEYKIFGGAKETIKKHQPFIVFEVGQYIMKEHNLDMMYYINYFESINYNLFNSSNLKQINSDNWLKVLPELGTIDILAIPK